MHLHILGICGTFMGSLALIARELGYRVTGSDLNVYPPMSTQLASEGIELIEGYDPAQLNPKPDLVVIGNAMSRGNPCVEAILDLGIPYQSGPQWLHDHLLQNRWVLAVSGTHGKTTTASMLAWILEYAGMKPGYLIGGVPLNFDRSARVGETDFFVIEADEYDTAFFDKRSKFVHYAPRTLVINNLEFDHADIFPDLAAIERQFHHLLRVVPSSGQVIAPGYSESIRRVLDQGVWSELCLTSFDEHDSDSGAWVKPIATDGRQFEVVLRSGETCKVSWELQGTHNQVNALHAILAAHHVGVTLEISAEALSSFQNVKRRMEWLGEYGGISIYDDFAHHPTAIATTLEGLRARLGAKKLIAVIEPRSNTMKQGVFQSLLAPSAATADRVYWYQPSSQNWSLTECLAGADNQIVYKDFSKMLADIAIEVEQGSHLVVMSNGGFNGIHEKLKKIFEAR